MGRPATSNALALHQLPGPLVTQDDVEGEKWYQCIEAWPPEGSGGLRAKPGEWLQVAEAALSSATRGYVQKHGRGGGVAARALGKEQTIGDRIASVTLRVQESPVHMLEDLRILLSFAKKKGRRERMPAAEALKDLFVNSLLPPERRLVQFEDREFECGAAQGISKRQIAYAFFESQLKGIYREFLAIVEECGKDSLVIFKEKAVKIIADLLISRPECEKELLSMLVNKLGDPERRVSSTASFFLLQLIEEHHPQMRHIVIREVEQLLLRPNVTAKAQYFSVCFLNQIRFGRNDEKLARWLLRIYMEVFTNILDWEKYEEKKKDAKKETGKVKKGKKKNNDSQRKKKTLAVKEESHLMGAVLIGANRAFPYTKPEQDEMSYQKHFDALYHVAHARTLKPATHALSLLFRVSQSNATQSDRFYRALYSRIQDAAEVADSKQAGFLHLLYKAMVVDTDTRRIKAYSKRLLQAALNGSPAFAGACAVVLSECYKGRRMGVLKSLVSTPEGEDDIEHFLDVDKIDEAEVEKATNMDVESEKKEEERVGETKEESEVGQKETTAGTAHYDPFKRDPQYAGAEHSCLWELVSLCNHFHPSIAKFAKSLCVDLKNIEYGSDPLKDFSEIAFLDKFVYKKPKNRVTRSLHGKRSMTYGDKPVANSAAFQELAQSGKIGEDDKFFLKFFKAHPDRISHLDVEKIEDEGISGEESEEEAFEAAMQAELRRLGADEGFMSEGIKHDVGDVDVEDEDEMQAFEEAFKSDMIGDGNMDEDSEEEESEEEAKSGKRNKEKRDKKKQKKEKGSEDVFAAAEDYREEIDADAAREKHKRVRGDEDNGVGLEKRGKPKKRRKKKV